MSPQNDKPTTYENGINLDDLWKSIIKRKRLIFWLFIISIISTGIISFAMPKIYQGEVAVRIQPKDSSSTTKELISTKELYGIIGNFDREKIQTIFPQYSDSVQNVSIIQIPGSTDKFKIIIELRKPNDFQEAVKIFVQYLNNIPLMARAVEQSREQLTKRLEEIDVVMLKSQEDAERFQNMMVKEKLNPIGFNPVQFNRMRSDLEVEKVILKQQIKNLTGFEIVTDPILFQKPVRPRPMLYLTVAGILGLFGGLCIALFMNFLEKVKGEKI